MKKVAYHDYENLSQIGELVEAEVISYFTPEKPSTNGGYGFGFAKTPDGRSYFFHVNNGHMMCPRGVEKLTFIPEFRDEWRPGEVFSEPTVGAKIVGVLGSGRKGKVCLLEWSYPLEYAKALALCDVYRELELERLERDPNFRLVAEEFSRIGAPEEFVGEPRVSAKDAHDLAELGNTGFSEWNELNNRYDKS